MKSLKSQNFYEVLGVARGATPEEIRSAYEISRHTFQENSLATYSLFSDAENQEILNLISKAFETLFNPDARRAYDATLEMQEGRAEHRPEPGRGEPGRLPPLRGEMGRGDLGRGELARSEALRPEVGRGEFARSDPSRAEMGRGDFARADAARGDIARGDMARADLRNSEPRAPLAPPRSRPPEEARRPPVSTPAPVAPATPSPSAQSDAAVEEFLRSVTTFDGATLKKLRLMRGISIDQLAEQTKIRRAYLDYIEEESFQFLPAAVYVKGFLTILSTLLRLPVQRVCADYMVIFNAKKH